MIIASLSIAPICEGTSVSRYVRIVRDVLKKERIYFETNAMATVIETNDISTLFSVVQQAHLAVVVTGATRIITELKNR